MKIANKISLSFVIITTLLISAVVVVVYQTNFKSLKEAALDHLETTTQSRARHIESILGGYKEVSKMMATEGIFREVLNRTEDGTLIMEQIDRRIKNILQSHVDISRVRVLDKNGITIVSSNNDVGFSRSSDKIFLEGKKGVYVGEMHISRFTGDVVISVAVPIFLNEGKEFAGVLVINFNEKEVFKAMTDTAGLGETGESYLINGEGYMITPSRFEYKTFLKQKIDTVNAKNCLNKKRVYVEDKEIYKGVSVGDQTSLVFKGYRGVDVAGANSPIQEMDWCLLAEIDLDEIMRPLDGVNKILLIIWIVIVLVAWGAGSFVARKITKPIQKLRQGVDRMAGGDLDHEVEVTGKDEISQLAGSFNLMTENLKSTTISLGRLNKEINDRKIAESKVAVKTKQLNKEVEKLRKTKMALLNIMDDLTRAGGEIKDLKELDKMKDEFLNVTAHELKTPVTSILGMSEIMLRKRDNLKVGQIKGLNIIRSGASRLKRVVRQILTVTCFEDEKISIKKEPFLLADLIKVILPTLKMMAKTSGSKINIKQKNKKIEIISDKEKVAEVIYNLVENAVKYGSEKQTIVLQITEPKKGQTKVEVTDQGSGIPKKLQKKIFTKFSQLEPSLSRSQEGTGLGLYISKLVVDQLGGKIGVKSETGVGSTFYFTLPVGKPDETKIKEKGTK